MSNQEMQFADPDWKPSQQLDMTNNPLEQDVYTPQPINSDYREQNKWGTAGSSAPEQEGYTGLRPYAGPIPGQMQGGNFRSRPYRRRGRGPWLWIILALIIISLASGGMHSFNGFDGEHNPFNRQQTVGKPIDYKVTGQATIVINDPNGNVTVTAGQTNTDVIIQPVNGKSFSGNPNDIQPVSSQDGNTIRASVPGGQQGSVDLQVTVPQGAYLQLTTESGDISANGVDGQMTLTTSDGSINASNDGLSGQSTMTTNSGSLSFDGTIGAGGSYKFQTNSGSVDLTLPSTTAFQIVASTNSGSINTDNTNDFRGVTVQNNNSGSGANASGNGGGSSQVQGTTVTIKSDSGDINLH